VVIITFVFGVVVVVEHCMGHAPIITLFWWNAVMPSQCRFFGPLHMCFVQPSELAYSKVPLGRKNRALCAVLKNTFKAAARAHLWTRVFSASGLVNLLTLVHPWTVHLWTPLWVGGWYKQGAVRAELATVT
jgi:hypothetical protein